MDNQALTNEVWELIDDNCRDMSKQDYLEFLQGLRDEADMRADVMQSEIDKEN